MAAAETLVTLSGDRDGGDTGSGDRDLDRSRSPSPCRLVLVTGPGGYGDAAALVI